MREREREREREKYTEIYIIHIAAAAKSARVSEANDIGAAFSGKHLPRAKWNESSRCSLAFRHAGRRWPTSYVRLVDRMTDVQ